MSVSTDGILFFGFDLGSEDDELPWTGEYEGEDSINLDEWVASKLGIKPPNEEWSEKNETKELYYEYWEKKGSLLTNSECGIGIHCSWNYSMYYVCISSKEISASRGYPESISNDFLTISDDDIEKLRKFCKICGIKWQEPGWVLTSLWG